MYEKQVNFVAIAMLQWPQQTFLIL